MKPGLLRVRRWPQNLYKRANKIPMWCVGHAVSQSSVSSISTNLRACETNRSNPQDGDRRRHQRQTSKRRCGVICLWSNISFGGWGCCMQQRIMSITDKPPPTKCSSCLVSLLGCPCSSLSTLATPNNCVKSMPPKAHLYPAFFTYQPASSCSASARTDRRDLLDHGCSAQISVGSVSPNAFFQG